jgi:hypothetical protein
VIDPDWRPVPGLKSRVRVWECFAAQSTRDFAEMFAERMAVREDPDRMTVRRPGILALPYGTPVLILADHEVRPSADPEMYPVEVRVTGGEYEGKVLFVGRKDIAWMIDRRVVHDFRPGDRATVAGPFSVISGHPDQIEIYGTTVALGNPDSVAAMFRDGRVTKLPGGVKVVVLGVSDDAARVRIHSGSKMAGRTGFMPRADLVPAPGK